MKKTKNKRESSDTALNRNIKGMHEFISSKKGAGFLIAMFFILLVILMFGSKEQSGMGKVKSDDVEKRLAHIISRAEGVEKAEVMITYESPKQKSVAASEDLYSFGISKKDESLNEDKEIRGVVVAVKGAEDYSIKISIIDIVKTALDVPANKIEVISMK